jgi:hypothetical protein
MYRRCGRSGTNKRALPAAVFRAADVIAWGGRYVTEPTRPRGARFGQGDPWRSGRRARTALRDVFHHLCRQGEHCDRGNRDQERIWPQQYRAWARAGAFGLAYALFQIVGGWIGAKFGPRRTLFACAVVWSTATMATGLVGGFVSLVVVRFVLGLGEGATFPTATRAMSTWSPKASPIALPAPAMR